MKYKHISHLTKGVSFVWQSSRKWTIINFMLTIIQGLLPLMVLLLTKYIVDSVTTGINSNDKQQALQDSLFYIGLTALIYLLNVVCQSVAQYAKDYQAQLSADYVYEKLQKKSLELDLEHLENPGYFDKLQRARTEASFRPLRIVNNLARLFQSAMSIILIAGLLISFHWIIGIILLIATLPDVFIRIKYAGKQYTLDNEQTQTERKTGYYNWMLTTLRYAKEVRLFNLGDLFINRFKSLRLTLRDQKFGLIREKTLAEITVRLFGGILIYASFGFIVYQTFYKKVTVGEMVIFFMAFQRGMGFLRELLSGMAGLYEDNLYISNLHEFFSLSSGKKKTNKLQITGIKQTAKISFDKLCFIYPGSSVNVLKNIDLEIKPNEKIALVGENGAGKTTLVKLLCRLYTPSSGVISVDREEISSIPRAELREKISVVFQDYAPYNLTAKENIWLGDITKEFDLEKIKEAARKSGINNKIESLPKGYETLLGKFFEKGEELSIGEWQKMALARAFWRDSQIIVLDEPTSALDPKAEYEMFKQFCEIARDKTAIIISHRLSTIRMVDRVYVLHNAGIVEQGTHAELMSLGGKYAEMFNLQARNYKL